MNEQELHDNSLRLLAMDLIDRVGMPGGITREEFSEMFSWEMQVHREVELRERLYADYWGR